MTWQMLTESVLPFWILLFVLTPIWIWATCWLIKRAMFSVSKGWSWRRFHKSEVGSSYSFAYLIIIPPYILLMFCIVETSLILLTKMGTVYAAFAGARSAIVHYSEQDPRRRDKRLVPVEDVLARARTNAAQAMIPFASGMSKYQKGILTRPYGEDAYVDSYKEYYRLIEEDGTIKASSSYLKRKYRYAMYNTRINTNFGKKRPEKWDSNVELKLTYYYPFQFSIIGRIFGEAQANGYYVRPITSTVTLQNEAPQNDEQRLGIHYAAY